MPVNSNDIANQAIMMMGDNQPPVTGTAPNFDSSPAGIVLQKIYVPCIQAVQRQFSWDASRRFFPLMHTNNAAPFPYNYSYEYIYPTIGLEIWQVQPQVLTDPNDPLPYNWTVGNTIVDQNGVGPAQAKVIWTSVVDAYATYNNQPTEAVWDALFRETAVRLLASELAMAIAGRPETEQLLAQSSAMADQVARTRGG